MNYTELLVALKSAANRLKMVHSTYDGDVYTNWNTESVQYGSVNIGLESIVREENIVQYNVVLYYGDRLVLEGNNANAIYDDGFNVLQSILNSLPDEVSVEQPIQYNPFEQKFADYLAGVYARVTLIVGSNLGSCSLD